MKKNKLCFRLLSYHLEADTHQYGGSKALLIQKKRSISRGDTCNTSILRLPNHIGTHIDCPRHFFNSGRCICDYRPDDFIFLEPVVLDCPKDANEIIDKEDIAAHARRLRGKDMLLLQTGFWKSRGSAIYSTQNPGMAPETAYFIRSEFPNIRCIGIDLVSISPYNNREMGRKTHAMLLKKGPFKGDPVCIVEDMDLSGRLHNLKKVFIAPLFIKGMDSAPCTIYGIF